MGYWDEVEALDTARLDADLEQAEMEAFGNAIHAAQRAGRCTHGSAVGYVGKIVYPEQEGLTPGQVRCTAGCRQVFGSDDEWAQAIEEAVYG